MTHLLWSQCVRYSFRFKIGVAQDFFRKNRKFVPIRWQGLATGQVFAQDAPLNESFWLV